MRIEDLDQLEIIHGTFTLIFIVISILVGIRILLKFLDFKEKEYITVGLSWIFISSAWWGAGFSFLSILLVQQTLNPVVYLLIGNAFIPIAIICWIYSFTKLAYPHLTTKLLLIYLIIYIPYEIYIIYSLIVDPSLIAEIRGTFYAQPRLLVMIFQILGVLTAFVTGVIFSKNSINSEDAKVKLKGKLLLLAFILFTVGAFMDAVITLTPITLIIARLILITSSIFYLFGFLLPDKIAELLLKG
ncbi:MAG: hypothetical protein EU539_11185 [Promethearchaeota archaeon]|nr:MAG: hypothetical protein EU539_11185 [Candidatus Lokiarchaeota archaeon]